MIQKIMICVGNNSFEFDGQITKFEDDYIILKAKHGDIYIERKYLAFIQFLEEPAAVELKIPATPKAVSKNIKSDSAARFIQRKLKKDPLDEMLEMKMVPPSQYPDDNSIIEDIEEVQPSDIDMEYDINGDEMPYLLTQQKSPTLEKKSIKSDNLADAIKEVMNNNDGDFSMGGVEYKSPLQTIMGLGNAGKKTRVS